MDRIAECGQWWGVKVRREAWRTRGERGTSASYTKAVPLAHATAALRGGGGSRGKGMMIEPSAPPPGAAAALVEPDVAPPPMVRGCVVSRQLCAAMAHELYADACCLGCAVWGEHGDGGQRRYG